MTLFTGTSGDDVFIGTGAADVFDLFQGGTDVASGDVGVDIFNLGAALDASDQIEGGADADTLKLDGDYDLVCTATTFTTIEFLTLAVGHNYRLTTADANVAAGAILNVNASALGAANSLVFKGDADLDSRFAVTGGAGDDVINTAASNDTLILSNGGDDRVDAGAGTDTIFVGATLTRADRIDGGGGVGENNNLGLSGDYSAGVVLVAKTIRGIGGISFADGFSYRLTFDDGNVAAGRTLTVGGGFIGAANTIRLNGEAETDGQFVFNGGEGDDVLTTGAGNDTLNGKGGADRLQGNEGIDTYKYFAAAESTGLAHDIVDGFEFATGGDRFDLTFALSGVDAKIASGTLSKANFDTQLAAAADAVHLGAHHAVIFTPDAGQLAGHTFIVIDLDNSAGYLAGADLVIELVNGAHLNQLDLADFS